jgi:hypothetical protein
MTQTTFQNNESGALWRAPYNGTPGIYPVSAWKRGGLDSLLVEAGRISYRVGNLWEWADLTRPVPGWVPEDGPAPLRGELRAAHGRALKIAIKIASLPTQEEQDVAWRRFYDEI